MNKTDFIKEIYERYSLVPEEDIYKLKLGGKTIPIVTKIGAQKIAAAEKYDYDFEVVRCEPEFAAVKCTVSREGVILAVSYGSAEPKNVKMSQGYMLEFAEKRAKVRAILIAIGAHGIMYGDDENPDFAK